MSERYVAAAYVVFLVTVLVYVAIIALKLSRLEREVEELGDPAAEPRPDEPVGDSERIAVG